MKKIIMSLIFFLSFFNGVINDNFSGPQLFETEEVLIEIEEARLDENNLQISWNISGVDNIDQVILVVREFTADGLLREPLELKDSAASGSKVILWDGSNTLSLTIKILSTEYTQYSGPDCDSMFCYKDITTEITSDEKLIPPIPVLPVVPTTTPEVENPILEVEEPSVVDTSTNITFTNELRRTHDNKIVRYEIQRKV